MFLSRRYAHRLAVSTTVALLFLLPGVTKGLQWNFEPDREGKLTIEATKDGVVFGPVLFTGTVAPGGECRGTLPNEANDFQFSFAATDGSGIEVNQVKVGLWERWEDKPTLRDVLGMHHLFEQEGPPLKMPVLARADGPTHMFVDIGKISGVVIFDGYEVAEGRCPELPGYFIGVTPLEYDPTVGLDESPFHTMPFTGHVTKVGMLILSKPVDGPAVSVWGVVLVVLLMVATGAIAVIRRRPPAGA